MTEDEAKKLWCPHARIGVTNSEGGGFSVNRAGPSVPLRSLDRCLGFGCMAWRWTDIIEAQGQSIPMPQGNPHGYCGLAGKP